MIRFFHLIIITASILISHQFKLEDDNTKSAVILRENGKINIQDREISLTYATNISILNSLPLIHKITNEFCISDKININKFASRINSINTFKKLYEEENKTYENILNNSFFHLNLLESHIENFEKSNPKGQCKFFQNILSNVMYITEELERLTKNDFTRLGEILSLVALKRDTMKLSTELRKNNLTFPIDDSENFLVCFLQNTKFTIRFYRDILFLSFKFPIYKQLKLYEVYPKPLAINNTLNFIKTNMHYAAFNNNEPILYNSDELVASCSIIIKETYCKKPSSPSICDKKFVKFEDIEKIDSECFKPFPSENSATQIFSTIYFHILYPITVQIKCDKNIYPLCIFKSSRVLLGNCSIETPFFNFNYEIETIPYKLHLATHSKEAYGYWLKEFVKKEYNQKGTK